MFISISIANDHKGYTILVYRSPKPVKKYFMTVIKFIYANLYHLKVRFWICVIAGIAASGASLAIPLLLAEFTKTGLDSDKLKQLIVYLALVIIISLTASWIIRRHGEPLAYQYLNNLRLVYFRKLEELPITRMAKYHSGYVVSMVNQLGSRIADIIFDIFWTFTGVLASVGILIYITASKSFKLTAVNIAIFLIFIIVSTILARKMKLLADDMNKDTARYSQFFIDFMSNLITVKKLGVKDFSESVLKTESNRSNNTIQNFYNAHANRWLLLHSIYYTASFATIGYLLYGVSQGTIPASLLILFIALYATIQRSIERIAENIITFAEVNVYIKNLEEILAIDITTANNIAPDWQKIIFENVEYTHEGNASPISIESFECKKGDTVCIYGISGQGKTTVLNIIANYVDPQSGSRFMGDINYKDLNKSWCVEQLAFISQEVELFNMSLRDNLVLGQDISDDTIMSLLQDLQLKEWVDGLNDGINTMVGEKGLRLSAGQKQRLNLARGILLDRELYLLDEPTSHLDEETEQATIAVIQKYLASKTVVIVTHRPAIKSICNKFYMIKNHSVVSVSQ